MRPEPLQAREFAALMAPLAPFGAARAVVVGVSGGADSMALALLLRDWGAPLAVVVDHGLRPGSQAEARATVDRLSALGVPARLVMLGLRSGPDLGARARAARYAALLQVCRAEGRPDLLVGHHAQDQAETVLLRERAGSGAAGLAGMAALSWRGDARLLRPLLPIHPARLRATLRAASVDWFEDPTNADPATARGALRQQPLPLGPAWARAYDAGRARRRAETVLATELAEKVALYPTGHAGVRGELSEAGWSALLWTISGRFYPPRRGGVRRIAAEGRGTLHGVVVKHGLVTREPAAMSGPVDAATGAVWDGRFALLLGRQGATLGGLGPAAPLVRRRARWPATVLRTLPALRRKGQLLAAPHVACSETENCCKVDMLFRPSRPLAGAPFHADDVGLGSAEGDAQRTGTPYVVDAEQSLGQRRNIG